MGHGERSGRWWAVALVFAGCLLASARGTAEPTQGSLRLMVQPDRPSVAVGGAVNVSIGLRDAHNRPAQATAALQITLALVPPVAGATTTVTIAPGQSAATVRLQPVAPGILEIRATNPQTFAGGAFIRVTRRASSATRVRTPAAMTVGSAALGSWKAQPPPSHKPARPTPAPSPPPTVAAAPPPTAAAPRATGGAAGPTTAPESDASAPQREPAAAVAFAPPAPSPPPSAVISRSGPPEARAASSDPTATQVPHLALRYSPQRVLLADGQDPVTIQVFQVGDDADATDPATGVVKVNLFASSGTLAPLPLVVQGGDGRATLTSDHPGDVDVEFVASQPRAQIEGERRLRIHFAPPIHALRLEAKPAAISLVDETDLIVTLLDASGRAIATDEPRAVRLALDLGLGEIVSKELTIKPGEFEARTRFVATGPGAARISVASMSLVSQTAQLDVRLPLGLLAVSVAGGLIGGLLAFLRRRRRRWPRIAIGGVTGFLLYWAFMFGLMRVLPRALVINPLSSFALSVIGGWLGTEVFALLLNRLGLKVSRRSEPRDRAGREDGGHAQEGQDSARERDSARELERGHAGEPDRDLQREPAGRRKLEPSDDRVHASGDLP